MPVTFKKFALSLVLGVIFLSSSADADHVIAVSTDSGATFSNDFNVVIGDTVSFDFFLNESAPSSDLVNDGLIGFGLAVDHTVGLGNIAVANPNAFFDLPTHDERSATGFEWEYFDSNSVGLRRSSVLLGSLDFMATGSGTTTFTITDRNVGSGFADASWFTSTASTLDRSIFGSVLSTNGNGTS